MGIFYMLLYTGIKYTSDCYCFNCIQVVTRFTKLGLEWLHVLVLDNKIAQHYLFLLAAPFLKIYFRTDKTFSELMKMY